MVTFWVLFCFVFRQRQWDLLSNWVWREGEREVKDDSNFLTSAIRMLELALTKMI